MNPRYILGPCDRPGCTKVHGVTATSRAHRAKPMTAAPCPSPDVWDSDRHSHGGPSGSESDPPDAVVPALAGSARET